MTLLHGIIIIIIIIIIINRPDIVLHDKNYKICPLIDTAIPDDSNFNTKKTKNWLTSRCGRFTPGKECRYPLNGSMGGGGQSPYGRFGEEENRLP